MRHTSKQFIHKIAIQASLAGPRRIMAAAVSLAIMPAAHARKQQN